MWCEHNVKRGFHERCSTRGQLLTRSWLEIRYRSACFFCLDIGSTSVLSQFNICYMPPCDVVFVIFLWRWFCSLRELPKVCLDRTFHFRLGNFEIAEVDLNSVEGFPKEGSKMVRGFLARTHSLRYDPLSFPRKYCRYFVPCRSILVPKPMFHSVYVPP